MVPLYPTHIDYWRLANCLSSRSILNSAHDHSPYGCFALMYTHKQYYLCTWFSLDVLVAVYPIPDSLYHCGLLIAGIEAM